VTSPADGLTLATVQDEFPGWRCWAARPARDAGPGYYARRADLPYRSCYQLQAGSAALLREQIRAADEDPDADLPLTILGPPFGPDLPPGECGHPLPPQPGPDAR
jgi:hypothetical protein